MCDRLEAIQFTLSQTGGAGSGIGGKSICKIDEHCPEKLRVINYLAPSMKTAYQDNSNLAPIAIYNSVHFMN